MAHSFGRTVSTPKKMLNEVGEGPSGIAVLLHCKCMSIPFSGTITLYKPWYKGEYEVLTEKEYEMLVRYHDETCKGK
jgi:hypothetical protein